MRSNAYITVKCDKCRYNEKFELTAIAGGAYDDRCLDDHLEQRGWHIEDGDICESCFEDSEEED
jgi:hypothetical protein